MSFTCPKCGSVSHHPNDDDGEPVTSNDAATLGTLVGTLYWTRNQLIAQLGTTRRNFELMVKEDGGPRRIRWGIGKRNPMLLYNRDDVVSWLESRKEKRKRKPRTKTAKTAKEASHGN